MPLGRVTVFSFGKAPCPEGSRVAVEGHKGKWYRARLRRNGGISYKGKVYESPSRAAQAVTKKPTNGWWFWTYERAPGDRLRELRRS